ncbi:glutathione S-transferase family protein [Marinomonas agarivorans]|nr:glutathione S-transferase family protein [Marinomonas agarivorans]
MITVHHLKQSRSTRVLWLLEELNLPYQVIEHERDAQTRLAPESLKKIHPLGKAPVIVDGDVTLCESAAILEYIVSQQPSSPLKPAIDAAHFPQYLEWLHFAEGSLAMPVVINAIMKMEDRSGNAPLDGYIAKELAVDFAYIDNTLSQQSYFAGEDFTIADIMMALLLARAGDYGLLEGRENIQRYLATIKQRPAYQKASAYH